MEAFRIKNGISATRYLGSNGTETAGSVGYDLGAASYDSVSFSVLSQTGTMQGFRFGDSGSKVYIASASNATIYQYNLSTAYDISTASYASKSFLASSQSANSYAVDFKSDGTKMYILGLTNDTVYQYSLSTSWDVSTTSYDSVSFSVNSQETVPTHVEFKVDGTSFYVVGLGSDTVYQYNMTTAWDLSTASYASKSMSTGLTNPKHFTFKPDGTEILVVEAADIITQFSLTTAWDISTGSTDSITLNVSSKVTGDVAIQFNGDGTKLIAGGDGVDALHQYSTVAYTKTLDLSTGTTFSFTPSGATTVSFTNPPATGIAIGFSVEIVGDASVITWPSSIKWHLATAPTATATKELYAFVTTDGGTTYYGKKVAEEIA